MTHVLVADDLKANRQILEVFLKALGLSVTAVSSGRMAIDTYPQQAFSLVFLDLQMPDIDGWSAVQAIRALQQRRIPIIALSAESLDEQKIRLFEAGFDDFAIKPITPIKLQQLINRWLTLSTTENGAAAKKIPDLTAPASNNKSNGLKTSHPPLNVSLSLSLSNRNGELARDMLSLLLQQLPQFRQDLQNSLHGKTLHTMAATLHKLKGGLSYCGLPDLKDAVVTMEATLLKEKQSDEVSDSEISSEPVTLNPLLVDQANMVLTNINRIIEWQSLVDIDALFTQD